MNKDTIKKLFEFIERLEQTPADLGRISTFLGVKFFPQRARGRGFFAAAKGAHPLWASVEARTTGDFSLCLIPKEPFPMSAAFFFLGKKSELLSDSMCGVTSPDIYREFQRTFGTIQLTMNENDPTRVIAIQMNWVKNKS